MPAMKSYQTLSCVKWSWYQMFCVLCVQQQSDVCVISCWHGILITDGEGLMPVFFISCRLNQIVSLKTTERETLTLKNTDLGITVLENHWPWKHWPWKSLSLKTLSLKTINLENRCPWKPLTVKTLTLEITALENHDLETVVLENHWPWKHWPWKQLTLKTAVHREITDLENRCPWKPVTVK
jgi:hypothetical protein